VGDREGDITIEHTNTNSFHTLSVYESTNNENVIANEGGRGSPPNG